MNKNKCDIEDVLNIKITDKEYEDMKTGWSEFSNNPQRYKGTVVVPCVLHWLNELRSK